MKIQNLVLLVLGTILLTSGAMAFGYFLTRGGDTEDERTRQTTAVQGETSLSVDNSSRRPGQLFGTGSAANANDTPTEQSQLPGPDQFEVYEEYANEQSALYADIRLGDGDEARAGDTLALIYRGWLTDGTLFDQSRTNDEGLLEPFVFTMGQGQVIRGWEEGITGMKLGGSRRLVVPSAAGYGAEGNETIPPNAMLIFDVELVDIKKQPAPPTGL